MAKMVGPNFVRMSSPAATPLYFSSPRLHRLFAPVSSSRSSRRSSTENESRFTGLEGRDIVSGRGESFVKKRKARIGDERLINSPSFGSRLPGRERTTPTSTEATLAKDLSSLLSMMRSGRMLLSELNLPALENELIRRADSSFVFVSRSAVSWSEP